MKFIQQQRKVNRQCSSRFLFKHFKTCLFSFFLEHFKLAPGCFNVSGTIKVKKGDKKHQAAAMPKAAILFYFESKLVICLLLKKNNTLEYKK